MRPWHWIGIAAGLRVIAVAALVASRVGVPPALTAGGALVILAPIGLSERRWRQRRRAYRDLSPVTRRWVITDDEIQESRAGSTRAWRWPLVVAVDQHRDVYIFRQDGGVGLDLPRRALTDDQDRELRAFLTERGLLPPGRPGRRA